MLSSLSILDWLTIIGGSGGLMYWFDRWWNRPRIRVSVVKELPARDGEARVELEVENLSDGPNSLAPEIMMDGWSPTRKHEQFFFSITADSPRHLPPLTPLRVTATTSDPKSVFGYLWIRRYRISATRGRPRVIRLRWIDGRQIWALRAAIELTLFCWFGSRYLRLIRKDFEQLKTLDV